MEEEDFKGHKIVMICDHKTRKIEIYIHQLFRNYETVTMSLELFLLEFFCF